MIRRLALLIYYTRDEWPLRGSIESHIRAFRNWKGVNVVPVNVAFPYDIDALRKIKFDVIVYHTTAVALRWYPSGIEALNPLAVAFADHPAFKIAMPQDDYMFTNALCAWSNLAKVDLVMTPMQGQAKELAYQTLDKSRTRLETILTSYLENQDVARARERHCKPLAAREYDVCYRAWDARPWVGRAGQLKVQVGVIAATACARLGLSCDISSNPKDTIMGSAWFDFLGDARAVVGVEGGSSLHDPDGQIFKSVEAYLAQDPAAGYQEVVQEVLQGVDYHADFTALSPRHLEAILTRTVQILVEGEYSGVLKADWHYIAIKGDFSDLDEALLKLQDRSALEAMTNRAWADIVDSGNFHWDRFLSNLAQKYLANPNQTICFGTHMSIAFLKLRDSFNLSLLRLEMAWSKSPVWLNRTLAVFFRPIKFLLNRPPNWR
jgi:hypothetical protein